MVRHELERGAVHLARAVRVARVQLLKHGVPHPQVDVPLPVPLLVGGRQVGHRALVHLAHARDVARLLLQLDVVKPSVIVQGVARHLLLVLEPALGHHHVLDVLPVAVLLLKAHEARVQRRGLALGDVVQRVLVDGARALRLLDLLLKLGKLDEELLRLPVLAQLVHRALVTAARARHVAVLHLKLCVPHPRLDGGQHLHVALVHGARAPHLLVAQLKLDVRHPPLVVRLKAHPPLKHLARARHVAQHLLHVDVLVPQLVDTWQDGDRAVPHVARVVDEAVAHLHLGVLEPHCNVAVADIQGTLPHRARSPEVFLLLLPCRILDPNAHVEASNTTHEVLILLAFSQTIFRELLGVSNDLLGRLEVIIF
mmetsp:Transcript_14739/g.36759  ORF Transcript_14739/g.36759 Transcript_14739/m.36759 type:complete len:368 (-) Transcript_14739:232-1335(-)